MQTLIVVLLGASLALGCGGGSDDESGADAAPTVDGASIDAVSGADAPPAASGTLLDEAIATCVWTTGCLNPEDSFGGGAPNTSVSSCIATFIEQRATPLHEAPLAPWAEYRACTASATDCASFVSCLELRSAICGPDGGWTKGIECPDGTYACDTTCLPSCTELGSTCSPDRTQIVTCDGDTAAVGTCEGGTCEIVGPSGGTCLPGTTGTCSATSFACDGDVFLACVADVSNRFDCALMGQTCNDEEGCVNGSACDEAHEDACAGSVLTFCAAGNPRSLDCASRGGTCGATTAGRAGCLF